MRVRFVDPTSQRVVASRPYANAVDFQVPSGDLPRVGDVILFGDRKIKVIEPAHWVENHEIGTVELVLPCGDIIVSNGNRSRRIINATDHNLKIGDTVEFDEVYGVVELICDHRILDGDLREKVNDIRQQYLVPGGGKKLDFHDFGGYPDVVARARLLIETQLRQRERLKRIGAKPVKGILFTGPPGTGKTHLARIIADQSGADFFLVSGPSVISKWVGDTEGTLRLIFEAALSTTSHAAIIFFDEIDSIAERRSGHTHEASSQRIGQLLTLMDGFKSHEKDLLVIGATNRAEVLDPALVRPGRFDWEICFPLPNQSDRLAILEIAVRGLAKAHRLPLEEIALRTEGWPAARLASIWPEAALLAASNDREFISEEDAAIAFEIVASRQGLDSKIEGQ